MGQDRAAGRAYAAGRIQAYKSVLELEGDDPWALTRNEIEDRIRQHEDYLRATDPERPDHTGLCKEVLRWPYHWIVYPDSNGSGQWSAQIMEFPGCFAGGISAEDAISQLRSAAESWVMAVLERDGHHKNIPAPYKGKKQFRPFDQGQLDQAEDFAAHQAYLWARQRVNTLLRELDEKVLSRTDTVNPETHPELSPVQVAPIK